MKIFPNRKPRLGEIIDYTIKCEEGEAVLGLTFNGNHFSIRYLRSFPQRKGIGRKVLSFLRNEWKLNRLAPHANLIRSIKFWEKMFYEGLIDVYDVKR